MLYTLPCGHVHTHPCEPMYTRIWSRVGQNHIYTVYIRYFWQGNHQLYGHTRCIYSVLANPTHTNTHSHMWRAFMQCRSKKRLYVGLARTVYMIYALYITVYSVISLPKIPYIHRIYMVPANPMHALGPKSSISNACALGQRKSACKYYCKRV